MNEMTTPAKASVRTGMPAEMRSPMGWLRSEIDRLFDGFAQPPRSMFNFSTPALVPALELTDGDKEYRLSVELPGLTDKDVEVEIADGVLSISGEKKEEGERKSDGYVVSERRYGSFRREVALPADVKADAITATFKDGVLTMALPKDESAPPRLRKIAIGK